MMPRGQREREREREITTSRNALIKVASMFGGGGWLGTSDPENRRQRDR